MAQILTGAPVAAALTDALRLRVEALRRHGVVPTLAILRLGERSDDLAYERGAVSRCEKIGVAVRKFLLPADCTRDELLDTIRRINADPSIHGCLMFRPLPNRAMEEAACGLLAPEKDVDCMTPGALAAVFSGKGTGFPPCTAQACMEILDHYGVDCAGKRAAVMGRSLVIGKPAAMMLMARNATVTICHTGTKDMPAVCAEAEILVAAAGHAGVVNAACTNPGQVVIDVGINVSPDGTLRGDVDFDAVAPIAGAITPVPGGVGSVTTSVLAKHVIEAAEKTLA